MRLQKECKEYECQLVSNLLKLVMQWRSISNVHNDELNRVCHELSLQHWEDGRLFDKFSLDAQLAAECFTLQ